MADRRKMTVDEFSLLMHSMYREWQQDQKSFQISNNSVVYYKGVNLTTHVVHVHRMDNGVVWVTLRNSRLEVIRPWIFSSKRKIFDESLTLLNYMIDGVVENDIEKLICEMVPSAKDIIAEKALTTNEGDPK